MKLGHKWHGPLTGTAHEVFVNLSYTNDYWFHGGGDPFILISLWFYKTTSIVRKFMYPQFKPFDLLPGKYIYFRKERAL